MLADTLLARSAGCSREVTDRGAAMLGREWNARIEQTILTMQAGKAAEQVRQNIQIPAVRKLNFRKDAELCGMDKILVDT